MTAAKINLRIAALFLAWLVFLHLTTAFIHWEWIWISDWTVAARAAAFVCGLTIASGLTAATMGMSK